MDSNKPVNKPDFSQSAGSSESFTSCNKGSVPEGLDEPKQVIDSAVLPETGLSSGRMQSRAGLKTNDPLPELENPLRLEPTKMESDMMQLTVEGKPDTVLLPPKAEKDTGLARDNLQTGKVLPTAEIHSDPEEDSEFLDSDRKGFWKDY